MHMCTYKVVPCFPNIECSQTNCNQAKGNLGIRQSSLCQCQQITLDTEGFESYRPQEVRQVTSSLSHLVNPSLCVPGVCATRVLVNHHMFWGGGHQSAFYLSVCSEVFLALCVNGDCFLTRSTFTVPPVVKHVFSRATFAVSPPDVAPWMSAHGDTWCLDLPWGTIAKSTESLFTFYLRGGGVVFCFLLNNNKQS
jgi:hypothetical protein